MALWMKYLGISLILLLSPGFVWAQERYLYSLSEPLEITTELGPVSRAAHVIGETSFQLVKAGLIFHATGQPSAALAVLGIEAGKMPPMITAQSIADLQLRDWFKKQRKVKELSEVPHLQRVSILTVSDFEVDKAIAKKQESTGIVFLETDKPLPADQKLPAGWGKPVLIADEEHTHLRLSLNVKGEPKVFEWSPSLAQVISADPKPMPEPVRKVWSNQVDELDVGKNWFQRHFSRHKPEDLTIQAAIIKPDGQVMEFQKSLAQGAAVEKMLGKTWFQKLLTAFGKTPGRVPVSNFRPQLTCTERFRSLFGK